MRFCREQLLDLREKGLVLTARIIEIRGALTWVHNLPGLMEDGLHVAVLVRHCISPTNCGNGRRPDAKAPVLATAVHNLLEREELHHEKRFSAPRIDHIACHEIQRSEGGFVKVGGTKRRRKW